MSASDFSLLHLKLDRVLAGQERAQASQADMTTTIETLTIAVEGVKDLLTVQREMLAQLAKAMSEEKGGAELHEILASIARSLELIHADSTQLADMVEHLPVVLSKAVQEGVRFAVGDPIDGEPPG